jgi:tight adherence protein C
VLELLLAASSVLAIGGLSALAFQLATHPSPPRPLLGTRGLKRARALEAKVFRVIEPLTRYVGGWVERWPLQRLREPIGRRLVHAGSYLGFSADEFLALSMLCSLTCAGFSWALCQLFAFPMTLVLLGLLLGALAPWAHISSVAQDRAQKVNRGLPAAVDLASLCMSAGLDFPGSLNKIVKCAADPSDPLVEEFKRLLQELELGYTRRRALEGLAERVPTEQVKEFVNSVVQAEEKGSPLASVLTIQSQTQRLRRSVAAEEMASEAALMLIGPMALIFLCVIILLLGPLIVRFMSGGFGAS